MKYVSIDIETTGLNTEQCDIIEFGAVLEDTNTWTGTVEELPIFHTYILPFYGRTYRGEPYALSMHSEILCRIATQEPGEDGYMYLEPNELGSVFSDWLYEIGLIGQDRDPITVAGKNFASFDLQFLNKLPDFSPPIRFNHRYIDPAMLYWDPLADSRMPNMETCLERAGIDKPVLHTAVDDARLVIELLRKRYISIHSMQPQK